MKQNKKIQNTIVNVTLIADMNDEELENYLTFSEVLFTKHLVVDSINQLPATLETSRLLTLLARTIKSHIDDINSKCDESTEVDA